MRIRVRHLTAYRYAEPARSAIQTLRLTPRNFGGQHVASWRIEVDRDCRLSRSEDAFGNILHCFTADGPLGSLTTLVEGEVETFDTAGVVQGAVERFPPALYLRETPLTQADERIRAFAHEITARRTSPLSRLHELLAAIYAVMSFDVDVTHAATTAAEAFEHKTGVCQDFAHLFIACARALDMPARYVSGYFLRTDGVDEQAAGHAWAEAHVDDLGWVGFDPAHGLSPNDAYIRVAVGLDYLGAAPIRGARSGGLGETMDVQVRVAQAEPREQTRQQSQN